MDLFVLGTIVVVFLVLLIASLLVNKMPSGKTFEEVQAEKKQLADQMKQQSRPAKPKGGTNASSGKKGKGAAEKKSGKGGGAAKGQTVKSEEVVPAEAHVEFVHEEIFLGDDLPIVKKSLSSTGLNKQQQQQTKKSPVEKKNKGKSGILVNKKQQEPVAVVAVEEEEEEEATNHFEEIHPKDDVEMLRAQKDEPTKGGSKPHKNAVNELRKEKKAKNKAEKSKAPAVPSDIADIEGVEQIIKANEQKMKKMSNVDAVDSVRGKRAVRANGNGLQALQKIVDSTDEIGVNVLIMLLSKAELSRSEIQIVIDYLLNKQSDSVAVLNSEWTEGKQDLVVRLKKQLAERETQLQNEQEAAAAIQEKLKLLRLELNTEKTQNGNTAKMYMWEMAQKEKEMELVMGKLSAAGAEKATLLAQMQKMQVTLVQQKNAMGAHEEHQRQLQQLQEANATLQRELEMYKNTVQVGKVDLRNLENDLDSARNEILQLHQKSFEVSEQMNRDLQVLSAQVSTLKLEVANYEQVLAEKKAVIDKYEADKEQNKGAEESLFRQLEEQKQKNNDLRTTNWKLMEAVTAAERAAAAQVHNENKNKEMEVLVKEKVQTAEKELKDKFTHLLTQISVFSNLKLDNGSNHSSKGGSNGDNSSSSSSSSNGTVVELDAWMDRVASELKKKLDVYENLLGTLKQQLLDQREKEVMMSVGGNNNNSQHLSSSAKSNSTKFVSEANGEKNGNGTATVAEDQVEEDEEDEGKTATTTTTSESNGNGAEVAAAAT